MAYRKTSLRKLELQNSRLPGRTSEASVIQCFRAVAGQFHQVVSQPTLSGFSELYWWPNGWSLVDRKADGSYYINITPEHQKALITINRIWIRHQSTINVERNQLGSPRINEGMVRGKYSIISTPENVLVQIESAFKEDIQLEQPVCVNYSPKSSVTFGRTSTWYQREYRTRGGRFQIN